MTKRKIGKFLLTWIPLASALILTAIYILTKEYIPKMENFEAPGKNWNSPKKVENYFIENMNIKPEDAYAIRSKNSVDGSINLRLSNNVTFDALVSNLYYYGFIKDEVAFRYALTHTKDSVRGSTYIKINETHDIDTNAEYRISEDMIAWQIADILLNRPSGHFSFDEYNYFFMP